MKQSEDFSFVRFLKIVKTLYESSTFTQLGRTVGTALGQQPVIEESSDEEDENAHGIIDRTNTEDMMQEGSGSLFPLLCSPRTPTPSTKTSSKLGENNDHAFALIEKMLGCNFLVHDLEDELSDEETCANHTFDDTYTMANDSTFDSISEDEYSGRRRRRSRRK